MSGHDENEMREATKEIWPIDNLIHSLHQVITAERRRAERDRLSQEARQKLTQMFGPLDDNQLQAKWEEIEETAQLFREVFYAGADGYNKRIIELVRQGVAGAAVNVDRDRVDNMNYTGSHIQSLQKAGITPDQYETKWEELNERLAELTGKRYVLK